MLSLSTFRSLKMCFCFVDVCVRADTPGKTARATTSPAIRHRVKTEARAISSANMTTSASALKVSTAQTFYPISCRGISPRYIPPSIPRKMKLFRINTYDLLVYLLVLFSNLTLLYVRITSSKVTGMTVEFTRLEDFHRLFRILRSYDQLQLRESNV